MAQRTSHHTPAKAVDLFCGAGGFTLAARNLGIEVVAALENNQHAAATYRHNFIEGQRHAPLLFEGDILAISPEDFMQAAGLAPGKVDIIMGGPPCQGFSTHRIKGAGVNDPRNSLLLRYFEYVQAIRPRYFLVENVPGLLWPRHDDYLKQFYKLATKTGYHVSPPQVLNARDYGVPQNRRRVFILGAAAANPLPEWPPTPTHFSPENPLVCAEGRPAWRTAAQVFSTELSPDDPNAIHLNHRPEMVEVFRSTPINGGSRQQSCRVLPCHQHHNGHKDVYGRINPATPGPTMTTACTNPSKGRFLHPTQHHGITVRHAARFQTFPDTFVFKGGIMAASAQVGNAVPIGLGMAVIRPLLAALPDGEGR
ncbi:DNA cytosine methyltransferase [Desulfovibrio oxamicus]|uniref:Cytosine-specific methyltransferase n=1 Tax=Nitratidesulfovibrio oxamicus TaxID=32016 RepID=A0ABS0J9A1_9BACT|nr:DNA cytosine methyltransferase [Nitratidesulfovibrio oxamicus]MBG3878521.1 DNA cytosine methyltransferase [Nitratidesulfovibrio oxamicus]